MPDVGGIAGDQLRAFIERYERLQEDANALNDDKAELIKEVSGTGFDKKIFKIIIKRRRMGKDACDEEDSLVDLYERAIVAEQQPRRRRSRARTREAADAEPAML